MTSAAEWAQRSSRLLAGRIVVVCALVTAISQFYRNAHVVVAPDIMRDTGVTAQTLGYLSGALFFSAALLQIPAGILLDRYGPRRMIPFMLLDGARRIAAVCPRTGCRRPDRRAHLHGHRPRGDRDGGDRREHALVPAEIFRHDGRRHPRRQLCRPPGLDRADGRRCRRRSAGARATPGPPASRRCSPPQPRC